MNKHIRPLLGTVQVGKLDAETLESFYAVLRRCRDHCDGRKRTTAKHRRVPLAPSTVRQIHAILSVALALAVRWRWLAIDPATQALAPDNPTMQALAPAPVKSDHNRHPPRKPPRS